MTFGESIIEKAAINWLKEKICNTTSVEVWITPVLVFTNAFVERTVPVKRDDFYQQKISFEHVAKAKK